MIGLWSDGAPTFAVVFALLGGVVFAIPLLVAPLAWARAFRWRLPTDTNLAVYFGRCLGAFAVVASLLLLRGGLTGTAIQFAYQLLIGVSALMVLVHVWGAIRRIQPLTETVEIAFWALVVVLGLLFYPG
jgi:hypothetical protein